MKKLFVCAAVPAGLWAQIPAAEDLGTKSKRESYQEGLEVREIRESAAKDVGEALARIDGMAMLRKGAIANDVVLRGLPSNNINVLIDGARIYGACPGHMDPAAFHVDFAEVERVEVTKGGFDVMNQGSLGGMVNVIRKRSRPGLHLTPSFQTGSWGYWNPSLTGAVGNERIEMSGGYSYRQSGAYRDGRGARMTENAGYRPAFVGDDAFRIQAGWGAVRFSPRQNQSGELSYARQDGANILYPYLLMDSPYDIADRLNTSYEVREMGGWVKRVRLQGYYTTVRHWMTDEKRTSSMKALDAFGMGTFARTRAAGGRADFEFGRGLVAGVESFQRNWNAVNSMRMPGMVTDQNVVPNVDTTVTGAYVDYSRQVNDRLRLGGGARIDTGLMDAGGGAANLGLYEAYKGTAALRARDTFPSANARVAVGLTPGLELFAGGATSVRLPDAQERYYNQKRMGSDWVGDPALRPSRSAEANLGLNFRRRGGFVRPSVYWNSVGDFIVVHDQARRMMQPGVMNAMARSYANVDARLYGGELSYGWPAGSRWLIAGGAAYTRGSKTARPELGIFNTNLAEIAPLSARSSVRYGRRRWFAEVEGLAHGRQSLVDTDLREQPTPGYATMNVRFGIHTGKATVTAGLENLLDRYAVQHLSYQRDPFRSGVRVAEPGRNAFVNVSYAF
jgi:iron complex outermembrane receptor protein